MEKSLLLQFVTLGLVAASPVLDARNVSGGIYTVDVFTPAVRNDDLYYSINIDFNGQTLPVLVDTGSADTMVVADTCDVVNETSGCYLCETYKVGNTTFTEFFGTIVGFGRVTGNNTVMSVTLGGLTVDQFNQPLISEADQGEFRDGSFSGLIGLGLRNVSRNYFSNGYLPLIDQMISQGLLQNPLFSLSLPRLGDPASPEQGKLTLGGIETLAAGQNVTYNEIIDSPNYNYDGFPLAAQGWTAELQALRMNGKVINTTKGAVDPSGRYMSLFTSGGQTIALRRAEFDAVADAFNGTIIVDGGGAIYFNCSIPQLLELKYNDEWFPVDPLDQIIPSDHPVLDGVEMCRAALATWDRSFADSIIGVPFLRNVISVFDYVIPDLYTVQPRFGLASTTDGAAAMERYPSIYKNRLLN